MDETNLEIDHDSNEIVSWTAALSDLVNDLKETRKKVDLINYELPQSLFGDPLLESQPEIEQFDHEKYVLLERDLLMNEISQLRTMISNACQPHAGLEQINYAANDKITELSEQIQNQKLEIYRLKGLDEFIRLESPICEEEEEEQQGKEDKEEIKEKEESLNDNITATSEDTVKQDVALVDDHTVSEETMRHDVTPASGYTDSEEAVKHNVTPTSDGSEERTGKKETSELDGLKQLFEPEYSISEEESVTDDVTSSMEYTDSENDTLINYIKAIDSTINEEDIQRISLRTIGSTVSDEDEDTLLDYIKAIDYSVSNEATQTDDVRSVHYTSSEEEVLIRDLKARIQFDAIYKKKLEILISDKRKKNEEMSKFMELFKKLQQSYKKTSSELGDVQNLFNKQATDLKEKQKIISGLKDKLDKSRKEKESYERQIHQIEIKNNELNKFGKGQDASDKRIDELETQNSDLMRSLNELNEQIIMLKKQLDDSRKNKMNKNRRASFKTTTKHEIAVRREMTNKKRLAIEVDNNKKCVQTIKTLKLERNHAVEEQLILDEKLEQYLDEIRIENREITKIKNKLKQTTNELNDQKSLHENMIVQTYIFKSSLEKKLTEVEELKYKVDNSNQLIAEMEEDIEMKIQESIIKDKTVKKVFKEKKRLKAAITAANDKIQKLKHQIFELKTEQKRLHKTITDSDRSNRKQSRMIEQLVDERQVLGAHIVPKNDELTLVNEELRTLQETLQYYQQQHEQYSNDIKSLKIENERLRQEKNLNDKTIESSVVAKQTSPILEEELNKAKKAIREQENHIKCLTTELCMTEKKAKQYQNDVQRISGELHHLKSEYFASKKENKCGGYL